MPSWAPRRSSEQGPTWQETRRAQGRVWWENAGPVTWQRHREPHAPVGGPPEGLHPGRAPVHLCGFEGDLGGCRAPGQPHTSQRETFGGGECSGDKRDIGVWTLVTSFPGSAGAEQGGQSRDHSADKGCLPSMTGPVSPDAALHCDIRVSL